MPIEIVHTIAAFTDAKRKINLKFELNCSQLIVMLKAKSAHLRLKRGDLKPKTSPFFLRDERCVLRFRVVDM